MLVWCFNCNIKLRLIKIDTNKLCMRRILPTKVVLFSMINQTESNMISLVALTINNFCMSACFSSNNTKRLFFYLSKFEEKTIFVSHNLLSLLRGLQEVIANEPSERRRSDGEAAAE